MEWTPDSRFVELVFNGVYQGNYQITQKVEESSNRVDVGDDGFLLEVDQLDRLDEDDVYFRTSRHLFNIKDPQLAFNDEQYNFIKNHINQIENTLFSVSFRDPESGYRKYIDVESFADWYIINELTKNNDAIFWSSVYMNMELDGRLKMGPIWDFDIALGNINKNGNENPEGFWVKRHAKWYQRLFLDEYFVGVVQSRFQHFSENKELILSSIINKAGELNPSQMENFQRWPILGQHIWPNYVYFDTYQEEVDYLNNWLNQRWDWMSIEIDAL